jgi:hypothetical protein
VTTAVAREIVLELDVEQPVHALDAPVTARSVSKPVDIERGRRELEARLERAAIGIFDARKDLDEALYVVSGAAAPRHTAYFMLVKRGSPG